MLYCNFLNFCCFRCFPTTVWTFSCFLPARASHSSPTRERERSSSMIPNLGITFSSTCSNLTVQLKFVHWLAVKSFGNTDAVRSRCLIYIISQIIRVRVRYHCSVKIHKSRISHRNNLLSVFLYAIYSYLDEIY